MHHVFSEGRRRRRCRRARPRPPAAPRRGAAAGGGGGGEVLPGVQGPRSEIGLWITHVTQPRRHLRSEKGENVTLCVPAAGRKTNRLPFAYSVFFTM
jgi:hypothetical protein